MNLYVLLPFFHIPWLIRSHLEVCCPCPSLINSPQHLTFLVPFNRAGSQTSLKQQLGNDKLIISETKTKYLYFIRWW